MPCRRLCGSVFPGCGELFKRHYKHGQKVGPLRPLRCIAQDDRELDELRTLAVLETFIRHREIRSRKMRQSAGEIRKKIRGVWQLKGCRGSGPQGPGLSCVGVLRERAIYRQENAWCSGADGHAPKQPHERIHFIASADQPEIYFPAPRETPHSSFLQPSLPPDPRPGSDRFWRGGRESKFLAV
jgi:hypothetical protein